MKRTAQLAFTVCFCLFLGGVSLLTLLLPKADSSYYENRSLAQVPPLTGEALLSGDYFSQWETWFTDHVALRGYLMKAQTFLQLNVLRQPVVSGIVTDSDVLLGRHGYGPWDTAYLLGQTRDAADAVQPLADAAAAGGGQLYYAGLPEQYAYYQDHYPDYLDNRDWLHGPTEEAMVQAFGEAGIPFLSLFATYREAGCPRDYYFATDHHYTLRGALFACQEILTAVNETQGLSLYVPQEADLIWETLPNPFLGSRNRKLFGLADRGDALEVAGYRQAIPFTRTDNGQAVDSALLALPADGEETVTYTVFMGGDIAETVIDTGRDELPSLLLIGESYTNAMETLIYAAFDETRSIDPRYYTGDITDYIARYQPEVVVILRDNTAYLSSLTGD